MNRKVLLGLIVGWAIIGSKIAYSQDNVGIGTDTPDPSAILEILSNDKGLLIPRMVDTSQVPQPATGLLIYQTADSLFYYWDAHKWRPLFTGNFVVNRLDYNVGTSKGMAGKTGPEFTVKISVPVTQ